MAKKILFLQGGGEQADYDEDARIVSTLQSALGSSYQIHYPRLPTEDTPDLGRIAQIKDHVSKSDDGVILVAHSLGASMLLRYLSENKVTRKIAGVFLLATPFWSGSEDWVKAFKLKPKFAQNLPKDIRLYFYHCQDDEVIPFEQFDKYRESVSWATYRELPTGGHQFTDDLSIVVSDIKSTHKS